VRRITSILFFIILAFASGMGIFHHHDEEVCHETSTHYCADLAHMDCSLCDVVIHPNDFSHDTEMTSVLFGEDDYMSRSNTWLHSIQIQASSDRAPPMV